MRKLHPYAWILGIGCGILVQLSLRYPPLSLFATIVGLLGFDLAIRAFGGLGNKKNEDDGEG